MNINKLITTVAICSLGFIYTSAYATKDDIQYRMMQQKQQAQKKLQQAKAASGTDRQTLLAEHMELMQKCMDNMNEMNDNAAKTATQRAAWAKKCQKMMDGLLSQMKEDNKMMMANCDTNMK